jgi:hypothetical protein
LGTTPTKIGDPDAGTITAFGKIVSRVKKLFSGTPLDPGPQLQTTFGSDAEARGYGDSPYSAVTQNLTMWAYERMRVEAGRMAAYRDYDLMDAEQCEVSSALDVISEFATQSDDPKAKTFNITSENKDFATYLMLRAEELGLDNLASPTTREIAKYGGGMWEMVVDESLRVSKVKPLGPHTMVRNETRYGDLEPEAFTQIDSKSGQPIAHFAPWQIVHGRYMRSNHRIYGSSILEPVRPVYKKLQLMEDGLVIGRLYRSHARFVFSVPVDGMSPEQAKAHIEETKKSFRKRTRYDQNSGKVQGMDSPIAADEDFFIGTRKDGPQANVDMLQGDGGMSELGDIEYFQNKIFAVLKVPKALLGFERDINAKATLTEQDINFARTLRRMQQIIGEMITQALTLTRILDGIDPERYDWAVVMPTVSTTDELKKWQTEVLKANVALTYGQKIPIVDMEYIWKEIMGLSQEEIERLQSLDPEDLGVQTMPSPPFENVGTLEGELGNGQTQPGQAQPTEARLLNFLNAGNRDLVRRMRQHLLLPENEPITDGEIQVVEMIRDMQSSFGRLVIPREQVKSAFVKARVKNPSVAS